jgi:hypothetical protein
VQVGPAGGFSRNYGTTTAERRPDAGDISTGMNIMIRKAPNDSARSLIILVGVAIIATAQKEYTTPGANHENKLFLEGFVHGSGRWFKRDTVSRT